MAAITREAPLRRLDWFPADGLDVGIYEEAAKQGKTVSMFLEDLKAQKTETPYVGMTKAEVLRTRRQMEAAGKAAPLTAFEECLWAAGIRAFGQHTDVVAKFFDYSDVDVLFPEFWSDRVAAGMLASSLVPAFVMSENVIDATSYHKLYIEDSQGDRALADVVAGEELPETKILVSEKSVVLKKYGRYVTVTYEDIKYQRLNVFGRALERIGQQIDVDRTDRLFDVLINGDGSQDGAATTVQSGTSGDMDTTDVINWATCLPTPYKMNAHAGRKAQLKLWYAVLAGFQNPMTTWGFVGITLPTTHEWDRSVIDSDYLIGVDSRYAVEHLTMGPVLTEVEKLVRRQVQGTAISHRDAFAIFDRNAIAIFDGTHA